MKLKLSLLNQFLYVEREDGLLLGTNLKAESNSVEIDTDGYFAKQASQFLADIAKEEEPEPFSEKYESMLYHNMKKGWQDFMKEEEEKSKQEEKFTEKANAFYAKMLTDTNKSAVMRKINPFTPSHVKSTSKEIEEVVFDKKAEIEGAIKKAEVCEAK